MPVEMQTNDAFTPMQLPRRDMPELEICHYRIYKSAKEYVIVEAASAVEAMRVAGIGRPYRVLREVALHKTLLASRWIGIQPAEDETRRVFVDTPLKFEESAKAQKALPAPKAAPAKAQAPAVADEEAAEGAVAAESSSQDDIDKLFS